MGSKSKARITFGQSVSFRHPELSIISHFLKDLHRIEYASVSDALADPVGSNTPTRQDRKSQDCYSQSAECQLDRVSSVSSRAMRSASSNVLRISPASTMASQASS